MGDFGSHATRERLTRNGQNLSPKRRVFSSTDFFLYRRCYKTRSQRAAQHTTRHAHNRRKQRTTHVISDFLSTYGLTPLTSQLPVNASSRCLSAARVSAGVAPFSFLAEASILSAGESVPASHSTHPSTAEGSALAPRGDGGVPLYEK